MARDIIKFYNTDDETKVANVLLDDGELALVREDGKERLYTKNINGEIVPIDRIFRAGRIPIPPSIQEGWIDSGLASWDNYPTPKFSVKFNSGHTSLQGAFTPPLVSDMDSLTSMESMFSDCSRLTSLDVSNFNTSNVTDMRGIFSNCTRLTSIDVSSFNTSNVTLLWSMFMNCTRLTSIDVSNFDTSKATKMIAMFFGCANLTSLDLSNFNTSNVTDMYNMFGNCTGLASLDISNFDTIKVTDMENMFLNCTKLQTIKCTEATKTKILTSANTGLPTDFNGWEIV